MAAAPEAARPAPEPGLGARGDFLGAPIQRKDALPDGLRNSLEALSGISLDHVKVRYNSKSPDEVGANAYTKGAEIHLARGQEEHLAHEAWHVVQQARRRVRPTGQVAGQPLNDDHRLEREADLMGARAERMASSPSALADPVSAPAPAPAPSQNAIQRDWATDKLREEAQGVANPYATEGYTLHHKVAKSRLNTLAAVRPAFAAAEPVIQRAKNNEGSPGNGKSLNDIARDVRNVRNLSAGQINQRLLHLREHQETLHFADPRVTRIERMTHVLSRQQLARQFNRPHQLTRLLSPHQLQRPNIGINSVRTSDRSLRRNIGAQLAASGGGTTDLKRLYSFMRSNGRAGFQGFHRDLGHRNRNIHGIIRKLGVDPGRGASEDSGAKFVLAAVDRRRLQAGRVFDTNDPSLRTQFERAYPRRQDSRTPTMFDNHASEGVVAHNGHVPVSAVTGIRAFRGAPLPGEGENAASHEIMSMEDVEAAAEGLLDHASAEPEPTFSPDWKTYRRDEDDDQGGGDPRHIRFGSNGQSTVVQ